MNTEHYNVFVYSHVVSNICAVILYSVEPKHRLKNLHTFCDSVLGDQSVSKQDKKYNKSTTKACRQ